MYACTHVLTHTCAYTHMQNGETLSLFKIGGRLVRISAGGITQVHKGVLCLFPTQPTATPQSELVRHRGTQDTQLLMDMPTVCGLAEAEAEFGGCGGHASLGCI